MFRATSLFCCMHRTIRSRNLEPDKFSKQIPGFLLGVQYLGEVSTILIFPISLCDLLNQNHAKAPTLLEGEGPIHVFP